jgi:hypothetical protein
LVDGEVFSWYGSRLLEAVKYFEKIGIWKLLQATGFMRQACGL